MSKNVKRLLAALLVITGGIVLVQMTQDRFIRMFIIACILFAATFMNKRAVKRKKLAELHARLEKELDEEERSAEGQAESNVDAGQEANDEPSGNTEEGSDIEDKEPE